jgi:hypothetical protein
LALWLFAVLDGFSHHRRGYAVVFPAHEMALTADNLDLSHRQYGLLLHFSKNRLIGEVIS